MSRILSAELCMEILCFVLQRERVRVPEIQKKFKLSYHHTRKVTVVLEKYGVISSANPNGRKVTAHLLRLP